MNEYFKTVDPDRLVHYEGNYVDPAFEASGFGHGKWWMYATPEAVAEYLENQAINHTSCANTCTIWGIL